MLSVAPWFGRGFTFFRELWYLTVVAFQRQGIIIIIIIITQGYNEIIILYTEIVNTYFWHFLVC